MAKASILCLIGILQCLMPRLANADTHLLQSMASLYAEEHIPSLTDLLHQSKGTLADMTEKDRNDIALLVARNLSIREMLHSVHGEKWDKVSTGTEWTGFLLSHRGGRVTRRDEINIISVNFLRHACEQRLVTTPDVIPHLIRCLDHPRPSTGQQAYYALVDLTRRKYGSKYWGQLVPDAERHKEVLNWWISWWENSRESHPVFDPPFEESVKKEFISLTALIESEFGQRSPELRFFRVKDVQYQYHAPIFNVVYDNSHFRFSGPPVGKPFVMHIQAAFSSWDLPRPLKRPAGWDHPEEVGFPVGFDPATFEDVYERQIAGTTVFLRIRAATENDTLIRELRERLRVAESDRKVSSSKR